MVITEYDHHIIYGWENDTMYVGGFYLNEIVDWFKNEEDDNEDEI
jgi:hypothetical protein